MDYFTNSNDIFIAANGEQIQCYRFAIEAAKISTMDFDPSDFPLFDAPIISMPRGTFLVRGHRGNLAHQRGTLWLPASSGHYAVAIDIDIEEVRCMRGRNVDCSEVIFRVVEMMWCSGKSKTTEAVEQVPLSVADLIRALGGDGASVGVRFSSEGGILGEN
ncbi:MAG TPA: hypothetical protein VK832_09530 [Burkholderiaceae bacterium]|nr:hypothetical protein [Burkholderiaceae bacterium]